MLTFNELVAGLKLDGDFETQRFVYGDLFPIVIELRSANKPYVEDGVAGNHLSDFLRKYGSMELQPIYFPNNGCPTFAGHPVRLVPQTPCDVCGEPAHDQSPEGEWLCANCARRYFEEVFPLSGTPS